jgi:hypothetical protein
VTGGIVFIGTNQGYLVVLGDPSVVPATGWRCSNIDYSIVPLKNLRRRHASTFGIVVPRSPCTDAGYTVVPIPKVLASVRMPDGGSLTAMRSELVLAEGRVFVATSNGHVYMLESAGNAQWTPTEVAFPALTLDAGIVSRNLTISNVGNTVLAVHPDLGPDIIGRDAIVDLLTRIPRMRRRF